MLNAHRVPGPLVPLAVDKLMPARLPAGNLPRVTNAHPGGDIAARFGPMIDTRPEFARVRALDTFVRALPLTLERHATHAGGALTIRVPGPAGGAWTCVRDAGYWVWAARPPAEATTVTIDADPLWRLCTRGIEPAQARRHAEVDGDPRLAEASLQMVSIIR